MTDPIGIMTNNGPNTENRRMTDSSLEVTDKASAAVAVAPRVRLADIEAAIADRFDLNGAGILAMRPYPVSDAAKTSMPTFSVCILVMKNGFIVVGKSAPASPENYNAELGTRFAYEDAVRQLWPLMGFALRETLYAGSDVTTFYDGREPDAPQKPARSR